MGSIGYPPRTVSALHGRGGVGAGVQAGGVSGRSLMPLGLIAALMVLVADQASKWWVLNVLDLPDAAAGRAAAGAEPDNGEESRGDVRAAERPWRLGPCRPGRRRAWRSSSRWGSGCAGRRAGRWRWRSGRSRVGRSAM